jgi:hypothetical protein
MRMKKRLKKPVRSRRSTRVKQLARLARGVSTRTMFAAVIGAGLVAVLIGAASSDVYSGKAPARTSAAPSAQPTETPAPPPAIPAAAESSASEPLQKSAAVTITGCLERDDQTFRLKDTSGDGAPRARSWKSGFLKKGSSPVQVTDAANRVKLPAHVGQRVSVTGTLVDREMHARSLQRVASSCSVKS